MTTDRHKSSPVTFRPPADDRAWLVGYSQRTGIPVGTILTEGLRLYRASVGEAARVLCAHANDGQPMHWLEPGEKCDR